MHSRQSPNIGSYLLSLFLVMILTLFQPEQFFPDTCTALFWEGSYGKNQSEPVPPGKEQFAVYVLLEVFELLDLKRCDLKSSRNFCNILLTQARWHRNGNIQAGRQSEQFLNKKQKLIGSRLVS